VAEGPHSERAPCDTAESAPRVGPTLPGGAPKRTQTNMSAHSRTRPRTRESVQEFALSPICTRLPACLPTQVRADGGGMSSVEKINELLAAADTDKDGIVSLDELRTTLHQLGESLRRETSRTAPRMLVDCVFRGTAAGFRTANPVHDARHRRCARSPAAVRLDREMGQSAARARIALRAAGNGTVHRDEMMALLMQPLNDPQAQPEP
jgi:hypothetical protein